MKVFLCSLSLLVLTLISCENENQQLEAQKVAQKNEAVFKNISKMWQFNFPTPRPEVAATLGRWNEWRQFEIEMRQKPQSTLSAFQMKTKNLSKKDVFRRLCIFIGSIFVKSHLKNAVIYVRSKSPSIFFVWSIKR